MKFDTKTCKPIHGAPQEAFVRPNKFVQFQAAPSANTTTTTTVTPNNTPAKGRRVMYLPSIVYTPVLASTRQREQVPDAAAPEKNKKQRRLFSADDMDTLNKRLENLFLGQTDKGEDDESDNDTQTTATSSSTASSNVGRVQSTTFNYKTNATSNVLRSARLQK